MKFLPSKHSKDHDHSINGPTGFFHRIGRDPYADWAIILTLTIVIAIAMGFFGFLTFENALAQLNASPSPTANSTAGFDAQGLANLLSKFDARSAESTKLQKEYDGPGDPSI